MQPCNITDRYTHRLIYITSVLHTHTVIIHTHTHTLTHTQNNQAKTAAPATIMWDPQYKFINTYIYIYDYIASFLLSVL